MYSLFLMVFVGTSVLYQQKLSRVNSIQIAANNLVKDRASKFSNEGFIQATLAFLEQNKDRYPDSYVRAQEICKQNKCFANEHDLPEGIYNHEMGISNAAASMDGLLRGISELNRTE